MAITIPTDNGVNKNVRSIHSEINYYVNARNFVSFDSMYDKNKTDELNTKEKYFNANKNNIYNLVDNDYILINSSDTYSNDTYYYMEDGTREDPCPICNGDGLISINEKDPSSPEIFACPKCNGKGKLIRTTVGVKVLGITVSQSNKTATGYTINYKVVPYGKTKSTLINDKDVI